MRLQSALSAAGACVIGSPDELQQVVLNLLVNARDAVAGAGGGTVQVGSACDGVHLDVYVGDDGPGLTMDEFGRLEEGFRSTKTDGLGLGLRVSVAIARRHGGGLEVIDEAPLVFREAARTVFRLRVPVAP